MSAHFHAILLIFLKVMMLRIFQKKKKNMIFFIEANSLTKQMEHVNGRGRVKFPKGKPGSTQASFCLTGMSKSGR
jgi:hypothetical protein